MTALHSPFQFGFTDRAADDLATALTVLTDPTRLTILSLLKSGPMANVEFEPYLPLKQPTISHHVRLLCNAGLVTSRKEGVHIYRSLNVERMRELSRLLDPGWSE
jgi:ArsR family transcriptional regulator